VQNSQGFSQGVFFSQGISQVFHSIFTGFHPIVMEAPCLFIVDDDEHFVEE